MSYNIDNFMSNFLGGARTYLFEWVPGGIMSADDKYFVRASKVPETVIEPIIVEYQQVEFKFGGKKKFNDWTISFNADKDGSLRTKFEDWSSKVHQVGKSTGEDEAYKHKFFDEYKSKETFRMLGATGVIYPTLTVVLHGAWPSEIGPIEMDYSNTDFAQFDVTFAYQYHEITKK